MRRPHDQYFTPSSACEVLKRHWDGWKSASILMEPCVGQFAIVESFQSKPWITVDIDPLITANVRADMSAKSSWSDLFYWSPDKSIATITNPPFKDAFSILSNALFYCSKAAFLLRLSFLEPTRERGTFLGNNPPDLVIVLPRISFTGDGKTDSVTCAWMIWDKDIKDKGIIVSPRPYQGLSNSKHAPKSEINSIL
jgi:hypothetical protein